MSPKQDSSVLLGPMNILCYNIDPHILLPRLAHTLEYQSLSYNDHEISFIFMDHLGLTHMHRDDSALVSN